MHKLLSVVLCIILVFSVGSISLAAEPIDELGVIENDPYGDYASSPIYNEMTLRAASPTIQTWYNGVTRVNSGTIRLTSYTSCAAVATKISVSYNLQRSTNNSSWSSYYTTSGSKSSSSAYSGSIDKAIATGYYYRVVTTHYSYSGSTLVSTKSATSGSLYF